MTTVPLDNTSVHYRRYVEGTQSGRTATTEALP